MRYLLPLFLFCFVGIGTNWLHAQPVASYRCHHAEHLAPVAPLTAIQQARLKASIERSDSFDLLHHDIHLDIIDFSGQTIGGFCVVDFVPKINGLTQLPLDLLTFAIDSVTMNGQSLTYTYDSVLLMVDFPAPLSTTDTTSIAIYYHGTPTPDPSWGGFKFDGGYAYNLGIGLTSNPYNMGRSWFPCFDNFVERATYSFHIRTSGNRRAYCIGTFLGENQVGVDTFERHYEMNQLLPTYLVNVAVTNYTEVNYTHNGQFASLPVQLVARPSDTVAVRNSFSYLGDAIDALENWYGAYWWERVGFVMTPQGAMEHPTNIAFPQNVGIGGPTASQNRLMTHELAHCWWGNVVTLKSPANMWIKEGNAEYGAHLFTEHTFGELAFLNEVKSNHKLVIRQAHFDDNGYWPLSGIPYEHAYGTHTYNKGASMLHNMRAYMGDSLFTVGQNSVLQTYAYQAIDAYQYRDQLATATGLDMNPYFDAWIFGTGFAGYELNDLQTTVQGADYLVTLAIEQKLRGTSTFHRNAPLEITLVGENYEKFRFMAMADGQFSTVQTTAPFAPVFAIINEKNRLNIAQLADERVITQPSGEQLLPFSDVGLTIAAVTDTAQLWIEHYWIAPDVATNPGVRLSGTHYWRFEGDVQGTLHAKAKLEYRTNIIPRLDVDLLSTTEDSLILVYRRYPTDDWTKYPYYTKNMLFNANDGQGFIRIDSLMLGEYAFANGELPLLPVSKTPNKPNISIVAFPNPTTGLIYLTATDVTASDWQLELVDLSGKRIWSHQESVETSDFQYQLDLSSLPNAVYLLTISEKDGTRLHTEKIVLQKP